MQHSGAKIEKILLVLEASPQLVKLEIDLNKFNSNAQLGIFLKKCSLIELKILNFSTENGIDVFKNLALNTTLKRLSVHFDVLNSKEIYKLKLPKHSQHSIQNLQVLFPTYTRSKNFC